MIGAVFEASLVLIAAAAAMTLWRAFRGPSVFDRILAVDTFALGIIGYLLIQESVTDRRLFFDAALGLALCAFIGAVFLGYFLGEGDLDDD